VVLLLVFRVELLEDEPAGSLMLLPREPALLREPVVSVPWSLPLQPTNNTAALAIANSFFIMVIFLLQTVSRRSPLLNR
jgi:hypothetical protein